MLCRYTDAIVDNILTRVREHSRCSTAAKFQLGSGELQFLFGIRFAQLRWANWLDWRQRSLRE
jgi:hypothetical protein